MSPVTAQGTLRTSAEVAELLGKANVTIRTHAKRFGIGTLAGRTYLFTEQDIERLRQVDPTPGRKRRMVT